MTPKQRQQLIDAALAARQQAYAPYSGYAVGAAVLAGGQLFTGCNVENASYGLTICAERVAVCSAVAAGQRRLEGVAIATVDGSPPCGACRQFLVEFSRDLPLLLVAAGDPAQVTEKRLNELFPEAFRLH